MYSFLLVDDEPVALKALAITIEQSGLPVGKIVTAGDGEAACRLFKDDFFDIVLTDIRMPNMDGLELCRILRSDSPETAVILVTGYEDFKYAHQAIKYDVKDYVLKPVTRDGIISSLMKVIEGIEKQKQLRRHLPLYELEKAAEQITDALWGNITEKLEEAIHTLFEMLHGFPPEYCGTIAADVLEIIRSKTAERTGGPFEVQFGEMQGNDHETVLEQLDQNLDVLRSKLELFRSNLHYNTVEAAKAYLRSHPDENVTLEDIAGKVGLTPSYFSQIFSRSTGQTFVQYRTELRMYRAMELLYRPELSIKEIAFKIGYNDENHFSRSFKKYSGYTPFEYRMKRGAGC